MEKNAWACWNDTEQEWVLKSVDDSEYCEDCGMTDIITVEIPDTE